MGDNFIGPLELSSISDRLSIPYDYHDIPPIPFSVEFLTQIANDFILILGVSYLKNGLPLTINAMRAIFGINPNIFEPCFYNQDWYLMENFAKQQTLNYKWYLLKKNINEDSRGVLPENYHGGQVPNSCLPSAILCTFTFFMHYFASNGNLLWEKEYVWTCDRDHNGDQIYVGRYIDPMSMNVNGFSIHRHLSITKRYGIISEIKIK